MKPRPLLVLVLLTIVMSGCAGSAATRETSTGGNAPPAASARVGLTEWSIITSTQLLSPGPVALTVTNAGTTAND